MSTKFPVAGPERDSYALQTGIYIGVGGNQPFAGRVGRPLFESAIAAARQLNITVNSVSAIWRSSPWPTPPKGQTRPDFFNAVWRADWAHDDPARLLDALLALENQFGRVRGAKNADRTLDLDLLDFRGRIVESADLTLPHPRMTERRFVLAPLVDVAPDWRHPRTGLTARVLLDALGPGEDAWRMVEPA